MRILYDAYWWHSGPFSGRVVMKSFLRAWREQFPDDELILAVRPGERAAVLSDMGQDTRTVLVYGRPHGIATLVQYPILARRVRADLALTQNFAPPGVPTTTFVHDVMYQTNPEWFTRPERAYFWLIPRFARLARLVVTSSQHEADRISACNPRLSRVRAVGLAVSSSLTDATPARPEVVSGVDRFLLTVGRLNIRKNLAFAIEAALGSGRLSRACPLVVVGERDGKGAALPAIVTEAVESGTVRFVAHVSDAELAWLYGHADLFVYLSLDEGFGLPPIEALTFGCPTLVSDIEVFRELLGDNATYVDPHDLAAASRTISTTDAGRLVPPPEFPSWADCVRNLREAVVTGHGVRAS